MPVQPDIIYLDNHLMVVNKPAGLLVQGDRTGDATLLDICKAFLKEKFDKPGNVFLGPVHRLDRPASGVIVLARTSKAASRLVEQFKAREVGKTYRALVKGRVEASGLFEDYISRKRNTSHISDSSKGQYAQLHFKRLAANERYSYVEIELGTGRHHQIRVQFARRGHPVVGDFRYGSREIFHEKAIALHAYSISFTHPTKKTLLEFSAEPAAFWAEFLAKESLL